MTGITVLGIAFGAGPSPAWPSHTAGAPSLGGDGIQGAPEPRESSFERTLIEAQPVCITSSVWSAGELGESLAYHYRRDGDRLDVGYFAFWSTERPWGPNALTLTVIPAVAIDTVYSHFLFVLPGLRAALYGPGDVEGATIRYKILPDKTLSVVGGVAQNGVHDEVELSPQEMLDRNGRIILMSDVWSHQLGAKGAAQHVSTAALQPRCFFSNRLLRLRASLVAEFRLGSARSPTRAKAAWRPFRDLPDENVAPRALSLAR
jgi:hypothetical protein